MQVRVLHPPHFIQIPFWGGGCLGAARLGRRAKRARFDTGIALYENYGDEEVTVGFDSPQPYFRLFSIGTGGVNLNKDFSNSSLITKVVKKVNCGETYCAVYAYAVDGREIFTLGGITILNNTSETKSCTLTNPSGAQIQPL